MIRHLCWPHRCYRVNDWKYSVEISVNTTCKDCNGNSLVAFTTEMKAYETLVKYTDKNICFEKVEFKFIYGLGMHAVTVINTCIFIKCTIRVWRMSVKMIMKMNYDKGVAIWYNGEGRWVRRLSTKQTFFLAFQMCTHFFPKSNHIMSHFFYKSLVRNKLFSTKYQKQVFVANSSAPPPP